LSANEASPEFVTQNFDKSSDLRIASCFGAHAEKLFMVGHAVSTAMVSANRVTGRTARLVLAIARVADCRGRVDLFV
jgi:hypothetical protein